MMQPRSGGLLQVKTTDISRYSAWMAAAVMLLALAACDDKKEPEEVVDNNPAPLTVESVINEPKVGEPGDTLLFTAVVRSHSSNEGDFPVYDWTADGGTFVEDNLQTVHWIAPVNSGIYTITATATNAVNSSSNHVAVFTGTGTTLVSEDAGQVDLIGTGPDFYFLNSSFVDAGVDVFKSVGGVISDAVTTNTVPQFTGINVAYSSDGAFVAHAADSLAHVAWDVKPRHIYVGDLASGTQRRLDIDNGYGLKRNVYNYPSFSPNGQVVTYQGMVQAQDGVSPDSFHVYTYDLVANKRRNITHALSSPRSWFPTFSTDGKWLTYVQDKNRNGQYDLYASPVTGNIADANPANAVRMTDTGGALIGGVAGAAPRPVMTWNPVTPVLAIVGADNILYLVQTTATGSNVTPLNDLPRPSELIWSHDGSMLAAAYTTTIEEETHSVISTISPGGAVTERVVAPVGDTMRDMTFSPDGSWLAYRVSRGGGNWIAVADLGAGKLDTPVPVTPTTANGQVAKYRGLMSIKPAWTSANLIYYPVWGLSTNGTASLLTRDLSGLVD